MFNLRAGLLLHGELDGGQCRWFEKSRREDKAVCLRLVYWQRMKWVRVEEFHAVILRRRSTADPPHVTWSILCGLGLLSLDGLVCFDKGKEMRGF